MRYGYRRIHVLLRREGWRVNAKRVWRLYREMGLQLHVWRQSEASEFPLPARWSW
jgi:transposase InsO family protein